MIKCTTRIRTIKRLKRAQGHPGSLLGMIEAGRSCLELAQQLHAVEKTIQQAKRVLVQDHIEHRLDDAIGPLEPEQKSRVDEFKAIARCL
jgi:hypothetical protein NreA